MIEAPRLLKDLKKLLKTLEDDIRERLGDNVELQATLKREWTAARDAKRTARVQADWLEEEITQAAAHWILACVFLRFIEDNGLVERPFLSGPGGRLALARDRYEAFFRAHPHASDREYLIACFREAEALPGVGPLFDEAHNPLWRLEVSGDGAAALLQMFRRVDPDSGALDHDFTDAEHGTRFLGDLYQDLSEAAKKRYALLQTPEFVERFILDRTLKPAIDEFGWAEVRLIDPACGSGHFLLDAFARLFDLRVRHDMNSAMPGIAQAALDQVAGVDINPFAVAIARFRLLVAALKACGIGRLKDAPDFRINVATGDSLLHGRRFDRLDLSGAALHTKGGGVRHFTHAEDAAAVDRLLGRQYHVVVGNPPYITPKDPALGQAYRDRYVTCHMKYGLAVPFIERFFDLAVANGERPAGFVGLIVANSFMKREFGRKLIERFFPAVDLTHVLDTAGAYIPGHGTPTAILFGRHRKPVAGEVRTVMGIKGEPATPADPAKGEVWQAILKQIDQAGSESAYVSVADAPRATFAKHPWSIGGGGAAELKEVIEAAEAAQLRSAVTEIGFASFPGLDDAFILPESSLKRQGIQKAFIKHFVFGEAVRDWTSECTISALAPYDADFDLAPLMPSEAWARFLWSNRSLLAGTVSFGGKTKADLGHAWWGWYRWIPERYQTPLSITFAFVATHNHFVLDRGGKVFKQSAPVIKLAPGSSEDDHLALLGLLNSSTACFWMKQVFHNKGDSTDTAGARTTGEYCFDTYEFTATGLLSFPLVEPYPTDLARTLDRLGQSLSETLPKAVLARGVPTRADLDAARDRALSIRRRMIARQEELDWRCYRLYGLAGEAPETPEPPEIDLGQRAFEIVLARQMAEGELETTWFERHGSTPCPDIPAHWPADYRALIEQRIAMIEANRWIALIERPEYKRRWQGRPWAEQEQGALQAWLLDRLEDPRYWGAPPTIRSVSQLAERVREDADFLTVAALYAGRADFAVPRLVAELVEPEAVPFLPILRYSEDGLRKRAAWEQTWELQRKEDAATAQGPHPDPLPQAGEGGTRVSGGVRGSEIPVPPKYRPKDFLKADFWRLRGGLDVPKERFISYPGCARDADGSLPLAWAGYDQRQQAEALWTYYEDRKLKDGWRTERLVPLLAGLAELLPWLKQWHNERDPASGARFGDFIADLLAEETRTLGLTLDQLRAWAPPAATGRRGRRKKTAPVDVVIELDF